MKYKYSQYLKAISDLSLTPFDHLSRDFSTHYESATFHILQKALASDEDIQILLPDLDFQQELLPSILLCITLNKYVENMGLQPQILDVEKGDILYNISSGKELKIEKAINKIPRHYFYREKGSDTLTSISISDKLWNQYYIIKANKKSSYNRESIRKHFKDYIEFFSNKILQNFKYLVLFQSKTLVISTGAITQYLKNIPYCLNGDKTNLIIDPMIEIAKNWEEAQKVLEMYSSNEKYRISDLIIIGSGGYIKDIDAIINLRNLRSCFKKVIYIGVKPLDTEAKFQTWEWTLREAAFLSGKSFNYFKTVNLLNSRLYEFKIEVNQFIEKTVQEYNIPRQDLDSCIKYIYAYICSKIIINKKEDNHFISDKLKNENSIILNRLIDYGLSASRANIIIDKVISYSSQMIDIIYSDNKKLNYFLNPPQLVQYILVCSEDDANYVNRLKKDRSLRRIQAISFRELDDYIKGDSEVLMRTTHHRVFIFTHIPKRYNNTKKYYYLLQKARLKHPVLLLQYEGIENEINQVFKERYHQDEINKLTSSDRKFFIPFHIDKKSEVNTNDSVEKTVETIQSTTNYFDDFLKFDSYMDSESNVDDESDTKLSTEHYYFKDKTEYLITFQNDTLSGKYRGDYPFILSHSETLKYAKDVEEGQSVLYFDIDFKECFDILKSIKDTNLNTILRDIESASRKWRDWLNSIFHYYKNVKSKNKPEEIIKKTLHAEMKISVKFDTFNKWFTVKEQCFFPRSNQDLESILSYYANIKKNDPTILDDIEKVKMLKFKNTAFREYVTKINAELVHFIADESRHKSLDILSHLTIDQIIRLKKRGGNEKILKIVKNEA